MANDDISSGGSGERASGETGNGVGGSQVGGGTHIGGLETGKPITINPADIGAAPGAGTTTEPGKRKRGRPAKSATPAAGFQETQALDESGCKAILLSMHTMMAAFFQAPDWMLEEKEAAEVAKAAVQVSRHYNVAATQKAIDWTNFAMVLGAVYGTRFVATSRKRKAAKNDVNQPAMPGVLHVVPPAMQQ